MQASRTLALHFPGSWLLVVVILLNHTPVMSQSQPDNVKSALKEARLAESGGLWFTKDPKSENARKHRDVLTNWFKASWQQVLANYVAEAPTLREQAILVEVAETLPPSDYLAYLSALLDQFKAGAVPQNIVESALSGRSTKLGFIAYNFSDQSIQSLILKAQSTLPKDSALQGFLSEAKAGNLRHEAILQRETAGMSMPETFPKDSGVTSPTRQNGLPTTKSSSRASPITLPKGEEPASSMPWSIIVVMIVAACSLLWLLPKRRS